MKRVLASLALVTSVFALASPAAAPAAIVTVGSPLTAEFNPVFCSPSQPCTGSVASLPESGATAASPVDGVVVRWRMLLAEPGRTYKLRVLSLSGLTLTGSGTSAPVSPAGTGVETFPTSLPIRAGQVIGLDIEGGARVGFASENGGTGVGVIPPIGDGESRTGEAIPGEIAINADVQPAPTIAGLAPASGSFKGGTPVTITGTDFEGAGAVAFGGVPATAFTVDSEGQITAVAPPIKPLAKVAVTVSTVAGTATSATLFKGTACVVPNLRGKKLKAARKKLKKKACKLGKVKGERSRTAKVKKQKPKPGKKLAPGGRVRVTLG